jgi:hypothetical protein
LNTALLFLHGMRGLCSRDADDFNDLEVISHTKNLIS